MQQTWPSSKCWLRVEIDRLGRSQSRASVDQADRADTVIQEQAKREHVGRNVVEERRMCGDRAA